MKILILITKAELGGAQIFALNLARSLKQKGEEVVVASGAFGFLSEELKKEGIEFHLFKNLKRGIKPVSSYLFARELKKFVDKNNFNLVHLNSTNTLTSAWHLRSLRNRKIKENTNDSEKKKLKTVFTIHGLSVLDPRYKANKLFKYAYFVFFKLAFKKIDELVFVSETNLKFAKQKKLVSPDSSKASLIYNALDLADDYFWGKKESQDFLLKTFFDKLSSDFFTDSFVCVSVGRLAYPKNYEFLISSFNDIKKEIPNFKLVIIGAGPKEQEYRKLIKLYRLEKEVILLGELKDAARHLRAFDLFILPSIFEGLSISLIEARLSKIPVLATLVGGNHEIITEENCYKLNNTADLITKVTNVYQGKFKELGREEELFSLSEMLEKYQRLYNK